MKIFPGLQRFIFVKDMFFGEKNQHLLRILLILIPNTIAALLDGLSFAFILLALNGLNGEESSSWQSYPLLSISVVSAWLHQLSSKQLFVSFIVIAILLQISRSLLTYVGQIMNLSLGLKIQVEAQQKLYEKILRFSFSCVSRYKTGDLLEYTKIPTTLTSCIIEHFNKLIVSALAIASSLVIMMLISVPLTLIAVIVFGLFGVSQKIIIRKLSEISAVLSDNFVDFSKYTVQILGGLRPIHIFDQRKRVLSGIQITLQQIANTTKKINYWSQSIGPVNEVMGVILVGVFLVIGETFLDNQKVNVLPQLLTFIIIIYRMNGRIQTMLGSFSTVAFHWGQILRLRDILGVEDKGFDESGTLMNIPFSQEIRFVDLSYSYPETKNLVINKLNLSFVKGQVTAIIGASGAGKSSIVDLLLRLYSPTEGSILVDKTPIQKCDVGSWRQKFGVVSQESFIFNETIEENIRFGMPNADIEMIINIAKMIGAHQFISNLPDGYQTILGERGHRLSGGERQKIALARALIRDPEVLVLDEATSNLDSHSEKFVLDVLTEFRGKKTIVVVAHRLSTIFDADKIIVLEKGRVIEEGTHDGLIEMNGRYAFFWNVQSQKKCMTGSAKTLIEI